MSEFITGIGTVLTTIFTTILQAFSGIGELLFVISETGITGVTPFGWLMTVIVGVPLATWLFSLGVSLVKRIASKK